MKKSYSVCILGNSHVAAVKTAWDKKPSRLRAGVALDFFALPKRLFKDIALVDGALVPERAEASNALQWRSGGLDRVEIGRYDAFVVVGSGFGIDLPRFLKEYGTLAHLKFARVERLVSAACFDAMLEAELTQSPAIEMIDMIRQAAAIPIVIVAIPFISERVLEDEDNKKNFHFTDGAALAECIARARATGDRIAAGRGCDLLWQDESTVAMPGFTRVAFNRGPVFFRGETRPESVIDDRHGNEEYGHLTMTKVLARLDAISGGRVLA